MNNLLAHVWKNQPGKYIIVSSKYKNKWQDRAFSKISMALKWIKEQPKGSDLYWCPTRFNKPRRIKENSCDSKFLWADLDLADPHKFAKELQPTIVWLTSPSKYQAVWQLDSIHSKKQIEALNRALAYHIGADKSGWDITQVLRVPGTHNYKYPEKPLVRQVWWRQTRFNLAQLRKRVKPNKPEASPSSIIDDLDIPNKIYQLLFNTKPEVGKRSDLLWYAEHELARAGLTIPEIYQVIRSSPWNKFKGRRDEKERLIHEINAAIRDEVLPQVTEAEVQALSSTFDLRNHPSFMADPKHYPGWLVENCWTRRSHGIVAGEPKSFKSTLVLDFAVSVASGLPFLNQFQVRERGPVLLIQNENAPWIMQDRLLKIQNNKRLIGTITQSLDAQVTIKFPPVLPLYYINQQGFSLSNKADLKELERITAKIRPVLVIFDPLYLMFEGDVNSAKDLNPILTWLLAYKERHETGLLIVHHWNKRVQPGLRGGQRMLGSTTLHGWIESAWYIEVKEDEEDFSPEETDAEDLINSRARKMVTIEREFRGAGLYPKMDLLLTLGEFGTFEYHTEISRHGTAKVNKTDLAGAIVTMLSLSRVPIKTREISRELGYSRGIIQKEVNDLIKQGKISLHKNGGYSTQKEE